MKQFQNFRVRQLFRYAGTALTVSLLVTLRVETSCADSERSAEMTLRTAPSHELHEIGLRQP